jgi:hypothetical protein
MKTPILFALLLSSILASASDLACVNSPQTPYEPIRSPNRISSSILIWLDLPSTTKRADKLRFRWKITNNSQNPVYVYSSLLKRPFFVETISDPVARTIEVRFTRIDPITPGVNYFPAADFEEIDPEQSWGGDYVSESSIYQSVSLAADEANPNPNRILNGEWRIRIAIGYGDEINSVQKEVTANEASGNEHPINPIVKWQKIQYSEYQRIVFAK